MALALPVPALNSELQLARAIEVPSDVNIQMCIHFGGGTVERRVDMNNCLARSLNDHVCGYACLLVCNSGCGARPSM